MYCKYGSYIHPLSNSDTQLLKTRYTCTIHALAFYVATLPSLGNIETCVWVLQTVTGEGVEKVEKPSPRCEGGEEERGPQSRTQKDKHSQWPSDYQPLTADIHN